ncbi:MAG: ammonium transporter [Planctomycetes bacterium]|nr:ammonium transporter [Planctomycetota bacterium]
MALAGLTVLCTVLALAPAFAEEGAEPTLASVSSDLDGKISTLRGETDLLWLCVAGFLVFWMQAGFAFVESGFTRAKNAVNILLKNVLDYCFGSLAFWLVGFGVMFGATHGGLFGWSTEGFAALTGDGSAVNSRMLGFWLFQVVFCATAATIVSGAMAERTNFKAYLVYSVFISAIIYPVFGHWAWGSLASFYGAEGNRAGWLCDSQGWLAQKYGAYIDFAGSGVVHSVGGWCALVGAWMVGPRLGKYGKDGKVNVIPGHNFGYSVLGTFILWLGWFGFNPGSTAMVGGGGFATIAVTTNLAGAAGAVTALIVSKLKFGFFDGGMVCNGILAGLVAITAPCANVSPLSSVIIGIVAGILVVYSVLFFERTAKIDDPVGAISVHLVNGVWGVLSVGLFAQKPYGGVDGLFFGDHSPNQLISQIISVLSCGAWTAVSAFILFFVLSNTVGLRMNDDAQRQGLDLHEHGMECYGKDTVL